MISGRPDSTHGGIAVSGSPEPAGVTPASLPGALAQHQSGFRGPSGGGGVAEPSNGFPSSLFLFL